MTALASMLFSTKTRILRCMVVPSLGTYTTVFCSLDTLRTTCSRRSFRLRAPSAISLPSPSAATNRLTAKYYCSSPSSSAPPSSSSTFTLRSAEGCAGGSGFTSGAGDGRTRFSVLAPSSHCLHVRARGLVSAYRARVRTGARHADGAHPCMPTGGAAATRMSRAWARPRAHVPGPGAPRIASPGRERRVGAGAALGRATRAQQVDADALALRGLGQRALAEARVGHHHGWPWGSGARRGSGARARLSRAPSLARPNRFSAKSGPAGCARLPARQRLWRLGRVAVHSSTAREALRRLWRAAARACGLSRDHSRGGAVSCNSLVNLVGHFPWTQQIRGFGGE